MTTLTRKQYNSVWDHVAQCMGRYYTKKYCYNILPEDKQDDDLSISYALYRMPISDVGTLGARWELVV